MNNNLREPMKNIRLYKALKLGYTRDSEKQKRGLKKYGYVYDKDLSSRERLVAYNPNQKKLLFIDNGTDPFNLDDITTDIALGTVGIKNTKRYENDKIAFLKAQEKYKPDVKNTILSGHSLGAGLISAIAPKGAQIYTVDGAIGKEETRPDALNIRTKGDLVSYFAPTDRITTLKNNNYALPITPITNTLKAHNLTNIEDVPIYF